MKFSKSLFVVTLALWSVISVSCASAASDKNVLEMNFFNEKTCKVYILDEKSHVVEGFKYRLVSTSKNKEVVEGFTSESGSFVIPAGKWILSGEKNNYSTIENQLLKVSENGMFFLEIKSSERVLNEVLRFYESENFTAGIELLNQIHYVKGSAIEQVVTYFREAGYQHMEVMGEEIYEEK